MDYAAEARTIGRELADRPSLRPVTRKEVAIQPLSDELEDAVDVAQMGREIAATGVPYVVDGIIPAYGMLGFSVGFSKVGKTHFGQRLAAHVAMGRSFLDRETRRCRVLALAPEDPPEYTAYLARDLDVERGWMLFRRHPLILGATSLASLSDLIRRERFGLVWIASFQAVVRGLLRDENDNAGMVQVVENVKATSRQTGIPWLIDAHSGKGEDQGDDADPSKAMRAASAAAAAADFTLSLRYANGTFGTQRRLSGKGRFVSFGPLVLDFDPTTNDYTLAGDAKSVHRETTWRLIEDMGALAADEPRTASEIARRIGMVVDGERLSGAHRRQIADALKGRPDVAITQDFIRGQKTTLYRRLVVP